MNKKVLAVAIVGSLTASAAFAAVDFQVPNDAVKIAQETAIDGTAGTVLTNSAAGAAGSLTLKGDFNYAFSQGEVRYARVSCTNGMRFDSASVTSSNPAAVIGAVNGIGAASGAIYFSITAQTGNIAATDEFYVDGNRRVYSNADNACSYELYDTPSQAAQGGTSGRITSATTEYLDFVPSYEMVATAGVGGVANVEASPAYTNFFVNNTTTSDNANLGEITTRLTAGTIYEADGTVLAFGDIIGTDSKHYIDGDFTFVANDNGTYTGAALSRVFLDVDGSGCAAPNLGDVVASSVTATRATFNTGSTPLTGADVCVVAEGTPVINDATYSVIWDVVTANATLYPNTPDRGPAALGSIARNGTQLQAPMVNIPQGYVSRVALTNTGTIDRPYTITVLPYEGATVDTATASLSGTIPARGGKVVELGSVITAFNGNGGATRAVVLVTVNGPNNQIQGQYQIVNVGSGAISNFVMVRPGTN